MSHAAQFLGEAKRVIDGLDVEAIERMAMHLEQVRGRGGRLFILGVGGSAANASHAVNDFRKIAGIEAYAPTDNVSELTARTNDEGWSTIFVEWLKVSRMKAEDLILVLSVGGGSLEKNVSPNLVTALQYAQEVGTPVIGIVGKDGGYTAQGGGRLRDRADGEPRPHHAALRGVPGGGLAPAGLAPAGQDEGDQMGVGAMSAGRAATADGLKRAVFLDRDGVLNRAIIREGRPYPPATAEEFEVLPGVAEAVRALRDAGFLLIGATNQPDVARGTQRREVVEAMNARLLAEMPHRRHPGLLRGRRRLPPPQAQPRPPARGGRDLRHRPAGQLHGRRPLARRRGRPTRRMPDRLHRPGLSRTPPRSPRRPRRRGPDRRRGLDPLGCGTDFTSIMKRSSMP